MKSRQVAPTVAALVRRRRDEIIARWARAERTNHPELVRLDLEDLLDSLPVLLDEMVEHFESHIEDATVDVPLLATAEEHGVQRVRVRITLATLVEEYAILRRLITRLVREEGLSPSPDEIEQFHAALDASIRRSTAAHAAATDTARDRMMGIVGHDLRNPLNAIAIGLHALRRTPPLDAETQARVVDRLVRSNDRALRLIRDLLDYSHAASRGGSLPLLPTASTDLVAVVGHVVDELRQSFPDRVVQFDVGPEERIEGTWDPDRMGQVVSNLLRNALQHSVVSAPVTVRVRDLGTSGASIEVHNLGEPIPPAIVGHLFEPFQQGDARVGRSEGNVGLGLYIASEIVRGHLGRIEVESTREEGTTFRVTIPRHAPTPRDA